MIDAQGQKKARKIDTQKRTKRRKTDALRRKMAVISPDPPLQTPPDNLAQALTRRGDQRETATTSGRGSLPDQKAEGGNVSMYR